MGVSNSLVNSQSGREGGNLALRLLLEQAHRLGWRYWAFALVTLVVGAAALLPAAYLAWYVRGVAVGQVPGPAVLLGVGAALALGLWLADSAGDRFQGNFRTRIERDLRRGLVRRLHAIPLASLDGAARGEWVERVTGDLASVERFLAQALPRQIEAMALFAGAALWLALSVGPIAGAALLLAFALAVVESRLAGRRNDGLARAEEGHGRSLKSLKETLDGMRTIRSHGAEPFLERRFEAALSEPPSAAAPVAFRPELAAQLLFAAALTPVSWSLGSGVVDGPSALAVPFALFVLLRGAMGLVRSSEEWRRFAVEGNRLGTVLYGAERSVESGEIDRARVSFKHAARLDVGNLVLGDERGVHAGPLSLSLRRGELWAVAGPPACGKSTLLEVLSGLRPASGGSARVVDRSGAVVWGSATSENLWLPIGPCAYVEPRPFLIEGSLRDNLTFGNADRLSEAVLWEFLERTDLYHFGCQIGGLDAFLSIATLSEGEKRKIALCRGLLLKRPFLLLDEPFRGLDERTVASLAETLAFQKQYSGIVLVTQSVPLALSVDGLFSFERAPEGWRAQAEGPEEEAAEELRLQANAAKAQPAIPTN